MRILILLSRFDLSGVTTNTVDLCVGLANLGEKVTLLVGKPNISPNNERLINTLKNANVRLQYVPLVKNFLSKIYSPLIILTKIVIGGGCDIIHAESPYYSFIPWLLRKKFTTTIHICELRKCFYLKKANHLIAISKESKAYALKNLGYKDYEVSIVNHGVSKRFASEISQKEILQIKQQYNIPSDKIIIGLVGSIQRRKGHDILLKAISLLPMSEQNKIHLIFCGDFFNKESAKWYQELVKLTGLENIITHIPHCDPVNIYKIFNIFCLPSRAESFPLVTIEAMLSGNCCIRSNTEGASEQIEHNIDGYIFPNEDYSQLAMIISTLIDNPLQIKHIGTKGQEKALKKFTIETMAKNTLAVYQKIVNE